MDLVSCLTTKFTRMHAVNVCSECSVLAVNAVSLNSESYK